jgi:hypothetical protein
MDADPSPGDLLASHAHNGVLTKKGWFDWRERYFELRGKKLSYFKSAKVWHAILVREIERKSRFSTLRITLLPPKY